VSPLKIKIPSKSRREKPTNTPAQLLAHLLPIPCPFLEEHYLVYDYSPCRCPADGPLFPVNMAGLLPTGYSKLLFV
jgi:hypothetical protein